jgi:hypothetical protein
MRPAPCPRLFEVEAARDGRLTGAELASFERHMTGCPACLREAEALEDLAGALRSTPGDDGGADMLHARRERMRLLAAFDRALVAPERRSSDRRWLLWPAAMAALVAGVLLVWRVRPVAQPFTHAQSAIVHADAATVWSERKEGNRERIVLRHGALWIHADHSSGEDRLLVELPDGELEDIGTTFSVSAEEGRTTGVTVQEGAVVLRIRGVPAVAIAAGDTWRPEARPVPSAYAGSATPAEPTSSERPALSAPAPSARPRTAAPSASAPESEPSVDFRAAMAALDAGDSAGAAAAFGSFLVKHPRDPRAEDAAYLRIIALQRSGDDGSMRQAAQEYLRRYPEGFRRAEMETFSR